MIAQQHKKPQAASETKKKTMKSRRGMEKRNRNFSVEKPQFLSQGSGSTNKPDEKGVGTVGRVSEDSKKGNINNLF